MKKVLSLVMALTIMLSLAACGGDKGTELTLENYKSYLDVDIHAGANEALEHALSVGSNPGVPINDGAYTFYLYNEVFGRLSVKGVSTNFNYEDVIIEVKITGQYNAYKLKTFDSKKDFSFELKVETNIAGEGKDVQSLSIEPYYTHSDFVNYDYEIVSISGRAVPVNG